MRAAGRTIIVLGKQRVLQSSSSRVHNYSNRLAIRSYQCVAGNGSRSTMVARNHGLNKSILLYYSNKNDDCKYYGSGRAAIGYSGCFNNRSIYVWTKPPRFQ